MSVVLASRAMTGPVFTRTYGYPGSEIDLIPRNVVPAGSTAIGADLTNGERPGAAHRFLGSNGIDN